MMYDVQQIQKSDFAEVRNFLVNRMSQLRGGRSEEWVLECFDMWTDPQSAGRAFFYGVRRKGAELHKQLVGLGCIWFDQDHEATAEGFRAFDDSADAGMSVRLGRRLFAECLSQAFRSRGPFYLRAVIASDNFKLLEAVTGRRIRSDSMRWLQGVDRHLLMDVEGGWQTLEIEPQGQRVDGLRHQPAFDLVYPWRQSSRTAQEFEAEFDEWATWHRRERQLSFDPACPSNDDIEHLMKTDTYAPRTEGFAWADWACFRFSEKLLRGAFGGGSRFRAAKAQDVTHDLVHVVELPSNAGGSPKVRARFLVRNAPCAIRKVDTYQVAAQAVDVRRVEGTLEARRSIAIANESANLLLARGLLAYGQSQGRRLIVHGQLGAAWLHTLCASGCRPDRWYQDVVVRRAITSTTERDAQRWVIEQFESTHRSF